MTAHIKQLDGPSKRRTTDSITRNLGALVSTALDDCSGKPSGLIKDASHSSAPWTQNYKCMMGEAVCVHGNGLRPLWVWHLRSSTQMLQRLGGLPRRPVIKDSSVA